MQLGCDGGCRVQRRPSSRAGGPAERTQEDSSSRPPDKLDNSEAIIMTPVRRRAIFRRLQAANPSPTTELPRRGLVVPLPSGSFAVAGE